MNETQVVRMGEYKQALTPNERIKCAYLHLLRGVAVQDLAIAFETNMGRVSEAVTAIGIAANDPRNEFFSNKTVKAHEVT